MNRVTPKLLESARHEDVDAKLVPSLERRRLRAYILLMLADGVLLNLSFALAALLWEGRWLEPRSMLAAQAMMPVFFTIAMYNKCYGVRALGDWLFATRKALIALFISAALINFLAFYTKSNQDFSRAAVTLGLLFTALLMMVFRRFVAALIELRWGGRITNRLVIDDGGSGFPIDGAVTISALFDTDYQPVPGTNPQLFRTRLTDWAHAEWRPFLDQAKASDPRVLAAACTDMNGFLPTHLTDRSRTPTGDVNHDTQFCRNGRIMLEAIDRKAKVSNAPYMMAVYRQEGDGQTYHVVRNVYVPLIVGGRRWGDFELAYSFD